MEKDKAILKKMGQTIAKKRRAADYTQEQVAERLGIGAEAFSRIERGLNGPGIPKLYAMAELFGCGIEAFFVESSKRPTDQAMRIERMLQGLTPVDRSFILGVVEHLSKKLKKAMPSKPHKKAEPSDERWTSGL